MRLCRLLLFFLLLLPVSGCSRPHASSTPPPAPVQPPAPSEPAAPPEPPTPNEPAAYLRRPYLGSVSVTADMRELAVDEERLDIDLHLPPTTTREEVKAALTIDAPVQPRISYGPPHERLLVSVQFPAGSAGEVISLRLAGPVGGAHVDFGFRLTRHPSPRVTTEIRRAGGDWESMGDSVLVLAPQPLAFRFRMHGGVDPDFARLKLEQAISGAAFRIEKSDQDTLLLTLPEPPPLLDIDFHGLKGEHGAVMGGGATVYVGAMPYLALLDPATGHEQLLADLPADPLRSSISPDGNWMMLSTMAPGYFWRDQVWVVNLRRMEVRRTALRDESFRGTPVIWTSDRLILPVSGQVQTYDLATGATEVKPSGAAWWQSAAPDGRLLLAEAVPPAPGFTGKRLNAATGQAEPYSGPAPVPAAWEEWHRGPEGWASSAPEYWSAVRLRAPNGAITQHGEGLVVGWTNEGKLLVIRWQTELRRHRSGI